MEKEFSRVRSAKDITITATLIITGCVLVVLPTSASINITGFFLIFTGLILAFVLTDIFDVVATVVPLLAYSPILSLSSLIKRRCEK